MKEIQLHILLGCADARDLSQLQLDAIEDVTNQYRSRGTEVELQVIRAAGSFVTPDVFQDIKRIIEDHQQQLQQTDIPANYFVHIQTHGHLTQESSTAYISHVHDLSIEKGSPLNCGMLGASEVGVELEKFILEGSPTITVKNNTLTLDSDTKIRELLKIAYAYDGYLAGDWIKSIDLLRTHPRKQRTVLENAIKQDAILNTLNINITAGIQDYALHALIRVDDGIPAVPFWDEVQAYVRNDCKTTRTNTDELLKQSQAQQPLAGLISMANPRMASRLTAADWYLKQKGVDTHGRYLSNTVFNLTGSSFDMPNSPFGPYVIAGFFYAVQYLHLNDQMVMGYNSAQTGRIMRKIKNDPIMNMIVEKCRVNLIPINQVDFGPEV